MNTLLEHLTGLHTLTDDVIAMDFLMKQLDEAIDSHEKITNYIERK